jgi:hypothetical protein
VALALAAPAFSQAEVSPDSLRVGRPATLTFTVRGEREGATIAFVGVDLPSSFRLDSGVPMYNGCCADPVTVVVRVTPRKAGDFAITVRQGYSDGEEVRWSGSGSSNTPAPVVHVAGVDSTNRNRLVIVLVVAAVAVTAFALRRGRKPTRPAP